MCACETHNRSMQVGMYGCELIVVVVFTCSFPSLCMVVFALNIFAATSTEAKWLPSKAHTNGTSGEGQECENVNVSLPILDVVRLHLCGCVLGLPVHHA